MQCADKRDCCDSRRDGDEEVGDAESPMAGDVGPPRVNSRVLDRSVHIGNTPCAVAAGDEDQSRPKPAGSIGRASQQRRTSNSEPGDPENITGDIQALRDDHSAGYEILDQIRQQHDAPDYGEDLTA